MSQDLIYQSMRLKQATENAKRNNLSDTVKFRVANVLDELPRLAADGEKI